MKQAKKIYSIIEITKKGTAVAGWIIDGLPILPVFPNKKDANKFLKNHHCDNKIEIKEVNICVKK